MFRATTPVRTKIPVPTIAPIPSIVKSSAPNVLANVFAYFHALTLQLASFEKFASSFTPPSFKFSENF